MLKSFYLRFGRRGDLFICDLFWPLVGGSCLHLCGVSGKATTLLNWIVGSVWSSSVWFLAQKSQQCRINTICHWHELMISLPVTCICILSLWSLLSIRKSSQIVIVAKCKLFQRGNLFKEKVLSWFFVDSLFVLLHGQQEQPTALTCIQHNYKWGGCWKALHWSLARWLLLKLQQSRKSYKPVGCSEAIFNGFRVILHLTQYWFKKSTFSDDKQFWYSEYFLWDYCSKQTQQTF